MVVLNPLDVILWTFRRTGKDVIKLYDTLSPVMQLATGGDMLNFGYWDDTISSPLEAQTRLCSLAAKKADLKNALTLLDVGSGLSAPARYWKTMHPSLDIYCININFKQLAASSEVVGVASSGRTSLEQEQLHLGRINATSIRLPFVDSSIDRVIALESAQHFRPIHDFIAEAARVLKRGGILVMAIPIIAKNNFSFFKLGLLSLTWSSEHYTLDRIQSPIANCGLSVSEISYIGRLVYEPLADYYVRNRVKLREEILKMYSPFVEEMLFRSIAKMKKLSNDGTIDYIVLKAEKK